MHDKGIEAAEAASQGFTRRSFLLGLGATAAVVAGSGLAGCAPQASTGSAAQESDGASNGSGNTAKADTV